MQFFNNANDLKNTLIQQIENAYTKLVAPAQPYDKNFLEEVNLLFTNIEKQCAELDYYDCIEIIQTLTTKMETAHILHAEKKLDETSLADLLKIFTLSVRSITTHIEAMPVNDSNLGTHTQP